MSLAPVNWDDSQLETPLGCPIVGRILYTPQLGLFREVG